MPVPIKIKNKAVFIGLLLLGMVLFYGILGPLIPYKTSKLSVCPVSGSTKTHVLWFGCIQRESQTTSALEHWLTRREPAFRPQWESLFTTTYYLAGRKYACGPAPEIYLLIPFIEQIVSRSSDEQLASLVTVLRQGSREEQRHMIKKLEDEYLGNK